MVKLRKYRRFYSLHNRYLAISIRDVKRAQKLKRLIIICALALQLLYDDEDEDDEEDIEDIEIILQLIILRRRRLIYEAPQIPRRQRVNIPRSIESFGATDFANLFRFRSHNDIRRVLALWDFPVNQEGKVLISDRGHYMFPEELFLLSIRRLSSVSTLDELSRNDFKSTEYSRISRGFNWFVKFTAQKFRLKFSNQSLSFFEPRFPIYAEAIRKKVNEKGPCNFQQGQFVVACFIDCNNTKIARPGAGPDGPGPNAPRRDPGGIEQEALYNGWLRSTGIKHQTVEMPDGLCGPIFGPSSCRHNDLWSFRESRIAAAFDAVQREPRNAAGVPKPTQYVMYGDGIYVGGPHIKSRHVGQNLPEHLRQENFGMASARESIEWSYGEIKQFFPFLSMKEKLKISNMPLGDIYFTCFLLRNCYNCLYHSKTSLTFDCPPPRLEDYMA